MKGGKIQPEETSQLFGGVKMKMDGTMSRF